MDRQTMTVTEISKYIGISKDMIYELVREKKIPHIRIGRRILFCYVNINNWLNELQTHSCTNKNQN